MISRLCLQRRETPELRAHLEFLKKLGCYAGTYGCMQLEAVHAVRCTMVLGSWCAPCGMHHLPAQYVLMRSSVAEGLA